MRQLACNIIEDLRPLSAVLGQPHRYKRAHLDYRLSVTRPGHDRFAIDARPCRYVGCDPAIPVVDEASRTLSSRSRSIRVAL